MVVVVARDDDKALIKKSLSDFFGSERPIIGFSTLSGREDLFLFADELKEEGAITILAGPQAASDYLGEDGWENNHHRFKGLSKYFTYCLPGPAEQAIPFLDNLGTRDLDNTPGLLYYKNNRLIRNSSKP